MTANRFIRREYLEEILLSLVTDTAEEEDLTEINELYEIYTSKLMKSSAKTELYFKQFIITFCILHRDKLAKKIHNEVERNIFIRNFRKQEKNNNEDNKKNQFFLFRWIILLYSMICMICMKCPVIHSIIQFCVFCVWIIISIIIFIIYICICVVYHLIKDKID